MVTSGIAAFLSAYLYVTTNGAQAGRARGAHVVLRQHLEHARARHARDAGHGEGAERGGRQHERAETVAAGGREPAEPDREHQDQQQAEPVYGHRLAQQHGHRADGVEEGVALQRGQDSGGHGHRERETEPGGRQLQRGGERLEDQREGRELVLERQAEVAADGAPEEAHVLDPQRIVEAEQRAELPDVFLTRLERQQQPRRIAGEVQEPEDDHRDAQQDAQALQEAPHDVAEHGQPAF